jgi:acyl-CoA reductase-like NAD-dependent aldehyde dehydrogenase
MAEMLEGQVEDLTSLIAATCTGGRTAARREVETAIDRLVCFAGWTDKYPQILGGQNPVDGPYYNFTIPEPSGVVGVVCPDEPALLGLISLLAPPLCAGNALVVVAGPAAPLSAVTLAEVCATSDVPAGVVNILTGMREDLLEQLAGHRQVDAISAANLPRSQALILELGAAENLKRVHVIRRTERQWRDAETCESPWTIEPFVEMKTIWHPAGA